MKNPTALIVERDDPQEGCAICGTPLDQWAEEVFIGGQWLLACWVCVAEIEGQAEDEE